MESNNFINNKIIANKSLLLVIFGVSTTFDSYINVTNIIE